MFCLLLKCGALQQKNEVIMRLTLTLLNVLKYPFSHNWEDYLFTFTPCWLGGLLRKPVQFKSACVYDND